MRIDLPLGADVPWTQDADNATTVGNWKDYPWTDLLDIVCQGRRGAPVDSRNLFGGYRLNDQVAMARRLEEWIYTLDQPGRHRMSDPVDYDNRGEGFWWTPDPTKDTVGANSFQESQNFQMFRIMQYFNRDIPGFLHVQGKYRLFACFDTAGLFVLLGRLVGLDTHFVTTWGFHPDPPDPNKPGGNIIPNSRPIYDLLGLPDNRSQRFSWRSHAYCGLGPAIATDVGAPFATRTLISFGNFFYDPLVRIVDVDNENRRIQIGVLTEVSQAILDGADPATVTGGYWLTMMGSPDEVFRVGDGRDGNLVATENIRIGPH